MDALWLSGVFVNTSALTQRYCTLLDSPEISECLFGRFRLVSPTTILVKVSWSQAFEKYCLML